SPRSADTCRASCRDQPAFPVAAYYPSERPRENFCRLPTPVVLTISMRGTEEGDAGVVDREVSHRFPRWTGTWSTRKHVTHSYHVLRLDCRFSRSHACLKTPHPFTHCNARS